MAEVARSRKVGLASLRTFVASLLRFLKAPFSLLLRHRVILFQTVLSDVRARYAGSVLGRARPAAVEALRAPEAAQAPAASISRVTPALTWRAAGIQFRAD